MNTELLALGEMLGKRYEGRISSWGRDEQGNKQVGGHPRSWHLWSRGANAIDIAPSETEPNLLKQRLEWIADEARNAGYETVVYKNHVHVEVKW